MEPSGRNVLVLFDIDKTLLKGSKIHKEAFVHAISKVYGVKIEMAGINYGGMTDQQIIRAFLERAGVSPEATNEKVDSCIREMADFYDRESHRDAELMALPGANELIEELEKRGVDVGLLTGNVERIAHLKLKLAGIRKRFEIGGFGEHSPIRSELVGLAIERARKATGKDYRKEDVFLVGDTPRDVEAAKGAGVGIIAVSTGESSGEELRAAGAADVLGSLEEIARFLRIIGKV
jgi:phosphoglycolate phosphatase